MSDRPDTVAEMLRLSSQWINVMQDGLNRLVGKPLVEGTDVQDDLNRLAETLDLNADLDSVLYRRTFGGYVSSQCEDAKKALEHILAFIRHVRNDSDVSMYDDWDSGFNSCSTAIESIIKRYM